MTTSPTKTSTGTISEVAKKFVIPDGITKTGYPSVAKQLRKMGIELDPWQSSLSKAILAKRDSGLYAAGIGGIVISICRQVGKTFLIASILFAICILRPGTKVLWTAHHSRTSDETFNWMRAFVSKRRIRPHCRAPRASNGQQEVRFRNGSRIMFGARGSGFGRGFDDVDVIVFDEAQILGEKALDAMLPATNAAKNPLVIYMGTPPKPEDDSVVFTRFRDNAYKGDLEHTVYVEIGADPNADLNDREQWAKANPSYPHRTREDAILRLKQQLGDDSFRREGLGIWDTDRADPGEISQAVWDALAVGAPPQSAKKMFAVAFSQDGMRMAIAGAVKRDTGSVHVEVIDSYSGPVEGGLAAIADWFVERDENGVARWKRSGGIVLAGLAGTAALAQHLRDRKVPERYIMQAAAGQYFAACSITLDMVHEKSITHLALGQEQLDSSVLSCVKQYRRNGVWGWTSLTGDETPTEAISLAAWGARTSVLVDRLGRTKRKAKSL
ncbi:hypothetical protein ACWGOE_07325 [Leucobacter chromiiresistens]